jgi:diguanylate cyclase (GGDEF)-like protein
VLAVSVLAVWTSSLRSRAAAALHHAETLATRDCLSGTLNRRALLERAEQLVRIRPESRPDLMVMMVDIDHFKAINDTYGHWVGDEVIVEIARRIETVLRGEDILARYGGDEFIAVLVGGRRRGINRVAERIRDEVFVEPVESSAGAIDVSVSVGGAAMVDDTETLADVIQRADAALLRSKLAGRNRATGA